MFIGFGKSTTAKLIQKILTAQLSENELLHERKLGPPADYDGVA